MKSRIAELDIIKGICIIGVVFSHVGHELKINNPFTCDIIELSIPCQVYHRISMEVAVIVSKIVVIMAVFLFECKKRRIVYRLFFYASLYYYFGIKLLLVAQTF